MEPTTFYFDSNDGNDANSGTSERSPLQNAAIMNRIPVVPGDTFLLKRGSEWVVNLVLDDSGTAGKPITLASYGVGAEPILRSDKGHQPIVTLTADHLRVANLHLASANMSSGFQITESSRYAIIEQNEIEQVGIGISVFGSSSTIRNNLIHDLTMVRNTIGGNDDFGAVGIWLYFPAEQIRIYRNKFYRCKAPSHDYNTDGGVLETWNKVSGIEFFQNYSQQNNGYFEAGSGHNSTVSNISIHHNLSVDDGIAFLPHLRGTYAVRIENIDYTNNTFHNTTPSGVGLFPNPDVSFTADQLTVRNNVFSVLSPVYQFIDDGFIHEGNLYHTPSFVHSDSDFELGLSEDIGDPLFSEYSENGYLIEDASPAIDRGVPTRFAYDFFGNPATINDVSDRGAIESDPSPAP